MSFRERFAAQPRGLKPGFINRRFSRPLKGRSSTVMSAAEKLPRRKPDLEKGYPGDATAEKAIPGEVGDGEDLQAEADDIRILGTNWEELCGVLWCLW